jgi:hypothetical protein
MFDIRWFLGEFPGGVAARRVDAEQNAAREALVHLENENIFQRLVNNIFFFSKSFASL